MLTRNPSQSFVLFADIAVHAALMPSAELMKHKVEDKVATESLASCRPSKRQRSGPLTRRAAQYATAEAAAALYTHSNVDSSQQQDKTDSSDVPLAPFSTVHQAEQSRLATITAQQPEEIEILDSPEAEAEKSPPTKRQRIARANVPAALSRDRLRFTDRLSGPHLPDTDEGHYVFAIGDNFTPRCTN